MKTIKFLIVLMTLGSFMGCGPDPYDVMEARMKELKVQRQEKQGQLAKLEQDPTRLAIVKKYEEQWRDASNRNTTVSGGYYHQGRTSGMGIVSDPKVIAEVLAPIEEAKQAELGAYETKLGIIALREELTKIGKELDELHRKQRELLKEINK
jgi:hypothetical protein